MTLGMPRANQAAAAAANTMVKGSCYNCHKMGHFAKECPYPKKQQTTYPAHVHHTCIEEILEGEPVTASMFPINQHVVVVLFDFGSSNSFMSQTWVSKDSRVVVAIMQVRCFFWSRVSSIPGAFSVGGHPFRCHSLWSSLVHWCCCNLNQKVLHNVEAKVRVR